MIRVRVPATSANLGPGFDALGLALRLYNDLELEPADAPAIEVHGEGERTLPRDPSHLAYRAALAVYARAGRAAGAFRIRQHNRIPLGRGLGSSAAAIIAGAVAANALLGDPLDRQAVLDLAANLEGHPDNVTAALVGGFVVCAGTPSGVRWVRIVPPPLGVVVAVPEFAVSTAQARRLLPAQVPLLATRCSTSRARRPARRGARGGSGRSCRGPGDRGPAAPAVPRQVDPRASRPRSRRPAARRCVRRGAERIGADRARSVWGSPRRSAGRSWKAFRARRRLRAARSRSRSTSTARCGRQWRERHRAEIWRQLGRRSGPDPARRPPRRRDPRRGPPGRGRRVGARGHDRRPDRDGAQDYAGAAGARDGHAARDGRTGVDRTARDGDPRGRPARDLADRRAGAHPHRARPLAGPDPRRGPPAHRPGTCGRPHQSSSPAFRASPTRTRSRRSGGAAPDTTAVAASRPRSTRRCARSTPTSRACSPRIRGSCRRLGRSPRSPTMRCWRWPVPGRSSCRRAPRNWQSSIGSRLRYAAASSIGRER